MDHRYTFPFSVTVSTGEFDDLTNGGHQDEVGREIAKHIETLYVNSENPVYYNPTTDTYYDIEEVKLSMEDPTTAPTPTPTPAPKPGPDYTQDSFELQVTVRCVKSDSGDPNCTESAVLDGLTSWVVGEWFEVDADDEEGTVVVFDIEDVVLT